jgi:hypothetical protein
VHDLYDPSDYNSERPSFSIIFIPRVFPGTEVACPVKAVRRSVVGSGERAPTIELLRMRDTLTFGEEEENLKSA